MVRALAEFPVRRLDVAVMTNTTEQAECASISKLLGPLLRSEKSLEVVSCPNLAHPHDLAWSHKQLISERFVHRESPYTHFVYLEDDTRFGYTNFRYFTEFRRKLADKGLIPSFVRTELNVADGQLYSTDYLAPFDPKACSSVAVDNYLFCDVAYPYCGLFVLDQELAKEHIASPSFHPEHSAGMTEWPIRERAAMGLCWENPPAGFRARYVVPVERKTGMIPSSCWVAHLPNNYANEPTSPYGKIPMSRLTSAGTPDRHISIWERLKEKIVK